MSAATVSWSLSTVGFFCPPGVRPCPTPRKSNAIPLPVLVSSRTPTSQQGSAPPLYLPSMNTSASSTSRNPCKSFCAPPCSANRLLRRRPTAPLGPQPRGLSLDRVGQRFTALPRLQEAKVTLIPLHGPSHYSASSRFASKRPPQPVGPLMNGPESPSTA